MSGIPMASKRCGGPWLAYHRLFPESRARLFWLPYAGGGASAYRSWQGIKPDDVEFCPVQPSGRENRLRETAISSIERLIEGIDAALAPMLDRPFALFGYSMGATVAFEWAHRLRMERGMEPQLLIVAARAAPQLPPTWPRMYDLPDDEFKQSLGDLSGTPEGVLENEELIELLLPLLRADFEIHDTYRPPTRPPLTCTIIAFRGRDDDAVPEESLRFWIAVSDGPFDLHLLPGDHFGLLESRSLPERIAAMLEGVLP